MLPIAVEQILLVPSWHRVLLHVIAVLAAFFDACLLVARVLPLPMPGHGRVERVFSHHFLLVVLNAELGGVLFQLFIESDHAVLVSICSFSFGQTFEHLYLLALALIVILLAKHPIFDLLLLDEHELMGWK